MAAVTSTSTVDEINAAYLDNCSYQEDASVAKAKAFVTVCRAILIRPSSGSKGGESGSWDYNQISSQLKEAQQWLAANDVTTAPTRHPGGYRLLSTDEPRY